MPYVLGIHLGGTTTSAAVARRDGGQWGAAAPVPLGAHAPTVPTLLHRSSDGTVVVGEAARRHLPGGYDGIARNFTDAIGSDVPWLVGSEFIAAQRLAAIVVEHVAGTVAQHHGCAPDRVVVAHPGHWTGYQAGVLAEALQRSGTPPVTVLPEPVAVALDYAARQPVDDDDTLLVCDAGAGRLRAAVVRCESGRFSVLGSPVNAEHPCGQDLDDAIFEQVRTHIAGHLDTLDITTPQVRQAVFGLRAECTRAKETLSHQQETTVTVALPGLRTEVSVSRPAHEQDIAAQVGHVPELLQQTLGAAGTTAERTAAIVLAGGTARIPLLRTIVSENLATPVQVDRTPELVAARGAAVSAVGAVSGHVPRAAGAPDVTGTLSAGEVREYRDDGRITLEAPEASEAAAVPPRPPVEIAPPTLPAAAERNRAVFIVKLCLAGLLISVGLVLTFMPGHGLSLHGGSSMFQQR